MYRVQWMPRGTFALLTSYYASPQAAMRFARTRRCIGCAWLLRDRRGRIRAGSPTTVEAADAA